MTKMKNTKKGMAKKTLSISLAVAMLATSNVPVWAAEFSDGTDAAFTSEAQAVEVVEEAPVVEEVAEDVPEAQAVADYTVENNAELSTTTGGVWDGALSLNKKDTKKDLLKITKNGVEVQPSAIEVYYNGDILLTSGAADGKIAVTSVDEINNKLGNYTPGLDVYKAGKNITVKVYVDGEAQPIATYNCTLKPYDITNHPLTSGAANEGYYNGEQQFPTGIEVGTAKQADGDIIILYENVTDGVNAGTYKYHAVGVEEKGYTGSTRATGDYTINAVSASKDNVLVEVSGDVTYNGTKQAASNIVVKDAVTGVALPKEAYTVTTTNTEVGTYDSTATAADTTKKALGITIDIKQNYKTADGKNAMTNFNGKVPSEVIKGSYSINALDLSQLGNKYNVEIDAKLVKENVTFADIHLTDKATNEVVKTEDVLGAAGNLVTLTTSNNEQRGQGTVVITPKNAADKNVVGSYTGTFRVGSQKIDGKLVKFGANTKIDGVDVSGKTLAEAISSLENKTVTYTGKELRPFEEALKNLVWVEKLPNGDEVPVKLGEDYQIEYTNNKDAGTATWALKFIGDYTGTITRDFTIAKATATVTGEDIPYVAGTASYDAKFTVVVKDGDKETVVPTSDYTVKYTEKAYKVGDTAKAVVTFTNKNYTNYGSDITVTSKVIGKSLSDETVNASVVGSYTYTGKPITPIVDVKDGSVVLTEGVDYKVTNKANIEAGTASVVVEGIGNYSGSITLKFEIAKAEIKDAVIKSGKDTAEKVSDYSVIYDGTVKAPDVVKVLFGGVELAKYDETTKKGDYILTYDENAKEVGTYHFTITAAATSTKVQGTYTGTYEIKAAKLDAQFVKKSDSKYTNGSVAEIAVPADYTGDAITLDDLKERYVVVDKNNKVLTEGKDYRLEYSNNTNAGQATVQAYGLGNYAYVQDGNEVSIATAHFTIKGLGIIGRSDIKAIADVEYAGGLYVEPRVTVKIGTKTLEQGKDFTVTTDVIKVGKDYEGYRVTVKGNGAYAANENASTWVNTGVTGYSTLKWNVVKKDLANTKVVIADNEVIVMNGTVIVPSSEYDLSYNEEKNTVTVTAKATSKNYTGSVEQDLTGEAVGRAMITDVKVSGNKATVVLSGNVDNAEGYDYVIATEEDYKNGRVDITKNQLKTTGDFTYVQKGVYYAYCHAWKRDENNKKVFGEWSNLYRFEVTATTPETPVITSVTRSGSTVKVTYQAAKNAEGYDVVLGTKRAKVSGEIRPVEYGTLVQKNKTTTTVTFKNVPAGSYYVGMHAYNRTSMDNKKVFSPWANWSSKVTVK